MTSQDPAPDDLPELVRRVRAATPARIFTGRVGTSYPTSDLLGLRAAHAAARDAVHAELDLDGGPLAPLGLFAVDSAARDRSEYLLRPDLGRRLSDAARATVVRQCPRGADLQVVVGDGLSAAAVDAQVPAMLPLLLDAARAAGWGVGRTFVVRRCRVGVMNDVGELLDPAAVVMLIGERPGLGTARSLSAYLGWRPRADHTDADRNLVSNIHDRGISPADAVDRVLGLLTAMRAAGRSGVAVKEADPPAVLPPP